PTVMASEDNYYAILEINPDASEAEVRKAYRQMALRWHPDKNQTNPDEAERRFKLISEAYETLEESMRDIGDRHRASNNIGGPGSNFFNFANFNQHTGAGFASSSNTAGAGRSSRNAASSGRGGSQRFAPLHSTRVTQTFTNTRDGRRVVVHKVVENGVETVTETVDGRVTKKTVDGRLVAGGDQQPSIRVK
uniref:J domain-containing protein n=1 Tax=Macrostomum lignano TaxID=282301 RepID=A0A1I8HBH9_9PLAT